MFSQSRSTDEFGPLRQLRGPDGMSVWDFTILFEDAILIIAPLACATILLSTSLLAQLFRRPVRKVQPGVGALGWIKLAMYSGLIVAVLYVNTQTLALWPQSIQYHSRLSVGSAAVTILFAASLSASALFHHIYSPRASSCAQLSLGWWILSDLVTTRSRWLFGGRDRTLAYVCVAACVVKFAVLLCEECGKRATSLSPDVDLPPESSSGIYNRLLFVWINPLMRKGFQGIITTGDLWSLEHQFTSEEISKKLNFTDSRTQKPVTHRNLLASLLVDHWWLWLAPLPTRAAQAALAFAQPFLIHRTLYWLYIPTSNSVAVGYGLLGAFALVYGGIAITMAFSQYEIVRLIVTIRCNLVARIYTRSLDKSIDSGQDLAPLTLMSTNVDQIVEGLQYAHEAFVSIPLLGIPLWLLKRQIGIGAVAPIVIVAGAAAVLGAVAPSLSKAQKQWLNAVKRRIRLATEFLTTMQSLKMSGLTHLLAERLQASRITELRVSLANRRFLVLATSLAWGVPPLTPVLAFAVYATRLESEGQTLNVINAFTTLSYISLITFPLLSVLGTLPTVVMAYSSLTQIDNFLRRSSDEGGVPVSSLQMSSDDDCNEQEGSLFSSRDTGPSAFRIVDFVPNQLDKSKQPRPKISLNIVERRFTMIVGPSGCGKSTLLRILLGEIEATSGRIGRPSDAMLIAYAAQTPWILGGSLKDNIVLNQPFDERWYRKVIHAVALAEDYAGLASSDIGAGGLGLSGGQRQKLSLARAVYSRSKICIIDEPFTGVDKSSRKRICERLFGPNGLLRQDAITLVIASHTATQIPLADDLIRIASDGIIVYQGPNGSIQEARLQSDEVDDIDRCFETAVDMSSNPLAVALGSHKGLESFEKTDHRKGEFAAMFYYFASLGWIKLWLVGMLVCAFVFFHLFPQPWLAWWVESNITKPNNRLGYWLGLYGTYGVLCVLALMGACWLMLCDMVRNSGSSLHATLCKTVEEATYSTFLKTNIGLIINRFSQDMSLVDMELPIAFSNTFVTFILVLGQLGLISSASKYLSIAIPPVVIIFFIVQRAYIRTSRQLRVLTLESKAPLYSRFIESLNGAATIRAYNLEGLLRKEINNAIDASSRPLYFLACAQRYLGLVLNMIIAFLAVALVGVANAKRGSTETFFYGQSLVNIMTFGTTLTQFIDYWCQFEVSLAAVERTKAFAESTPKEKSLVLDPGSGQSFAKGAIRFSEVTAEYHSDVRVINDLSLMIAAGDKVAVCGRSGSGKSTLCLALMRMLEVGQGMITIDGRDISRIEHHDLRRHIAAVPQEPLVFEESLRFNLDPCGQRSDTVLTQMCSKLDLLDMFPGASAKQKLDHTISADTLSMGEKQLICLGRALLRERNILVLDEATSSVDTATDQKIQQVVCDTLPGVTVISVMHRFDHISSYDRIVVMKEGRVAEIGEPGDLMATPSSLFSQLISSTAGA